jgi:hypothetical protein
MVGVRHQETGLAVSVLVAQNIRHHLTYSFSSLYSLPSESSPLPSLHRSHLCLLPQYIPPHLLLIKAHFPRLYPHLPSQQQLPR